VLYSISNHRNISNITGWYWLVIWKRLLMLAYLICLGLGPKWDNLNWRTLTNYDEVICFRAYFRVKSLVPKHFEIHVSPCRIRAVCGKSILPAVSFTKPSKLNMNLLVDPNGHCIHVSSCLPWNLGHFLCNIYIEKWYIKKKYIIWYDMICDKI